jgi:biofilm PGA synthesis N-glycosyltransferase PgaC
MAMNLVAIIIIIFGLINIMRVSLLFSGSLWYDLTQLFRRKKNDFQQPDITVIITAFNEEKVIRRCLTSVYESTYSNLRVIVANDGSTDDTAKIVRQFRNTLSEHQRRSLRLVTTANGGKARILNHVLRKVVKTPLVMVLDADSLVAPQAIEHSIRYFEDSRVVAVASNVRIIKHHSLLSLIQYIEYLMGHHMKKAYTSLNNEYIIGGIGSTFRYETIKQLNFFDTNTITEDIDLSMKIVAQGNRQNRLVFASDVVCFTEPVPNVSGLFRQRFRWKYGRFQTLYKQKHLFFNVRSPYSKLLTFLQLPFVIYSELSFLLDPLFVCLVMYFLVQYHDIQTIFGVLFFFAAFTAGAIIADEYSSAGEKILLLLLAPFAYPFFFIISIIEYFTLLKCIIQIRGIIKAKEIDHCAWVPVQRIG